MIIDQWYKSHVDKVNEAITITESENGYYNININGSIMACVSDKELADILVNKIVQFNERYRRGTDTFDIGKELEIITNNRDAVHLGSYFS